MLMSLICALILGNFRAWICTFFAWWGYTFFVGPITSISFFALFCILVLADFIIGFAIYVKTGKII